MDQTTVLLVDDDADIRKLITVYLKNEGYRILEAENGVQALQLLQKEHADCIVLDIMMPELDGIQALMKIREDHVIPVILLSAKHEDIEKITGLSLGADDYMTKPFNPLELTARVKSQIRRYRLFQQSSHSDKLSVLTTGDLTIDSNSRNVTAAGQNVTLTPIEFDILSLLLKNKNTVFSAEKIYQMIWKDDGLGSDNTVMVHIRKIREKLENASGKKYIETVWGVGYKIS